MLKFVKAFLYSQEIKKIISEENPETTNLIKEKIQQREVADIPFHTPLDVVEICSKSEQFSEAESYLIYYNLAFNYTEKP